MLGDPAAAVAEARAAGVDTIVSIGIDAATSRLAVGFAACFPGVYATVGLHPHEAGSFDAATLDELEDLARGPRVVAIGECGLDFYRDFTPRETQRRVFGAQIAIARRLALALVVHVREAGDEAMAMLALEAADQTIIMHCFSLTGCVDECNERGYYASFAGNVTYKNAGDLRAAAARVREDRLLVETDAPYLSPVPHRGKPNAPSGVVHTAAALAEVRGWSPAQTAAITTANAQRAFGLPEGE
jgi:TatD DNase family protein